MSSAAIQEPGPAVAGWERWLLLSILVALWGSAFGLTTVGLRELPAASLVGARLLTGWLVLLPLVWAGGFAVPRQPRVWIYFALIAVLGNCLPFYLITWGQQAVPSGEAGVLMSVTPLVVVGLAHFFLPGEPASRIKVMGVVVGLMGIWLLMSYSGKTPLPGEWGNLWRALAILAGAICYGLTIIIARRQPKQDPLLAALVVLGISTLLMLPSSWAAMPAGILARLSWQTWLSLLLLGPLCTGYATIVYFQLVRRAGATFLSLINYLIPLWAVAVGAIFLDERLHWSAWLAMLVVLSGVALAGQQGRGKG